MEGAREKFTIKITESGIEIINNKEKSVLLTASEALMLLDILKTEEDKLKKMAAEASPIPIQIKI